MPILRLTKGSKQYGIQTYARSRTLMPELQGVELEYLDVRDWYVNQLAMLAQYEEALSQAETLEDKELFSGKVHGIQSSLKDVRARVRAAGERSWAEAYCLAARQMLPRGIDRQIGEEADRLLGRMRHELSGAA